MQFSLSRRRPEDRARVEERRFYVDRDRVLVRDLHDEAGTCAIPGRIELRELGASNGTDGEPTVDGRVEPAGMHFGILGDADCLLIDATEETKRSHAGDSSGGMNAPTDERGARFDLPEGYRWAPLRSLFEELSDDEFRAAGAALQISTWARTSRFCGRCGATTVQKEDEFATVCTECGFQQYPRIAPAVIVAVVRDGKLLLAQNARYRGRHYSVIAGFVESGETLEECVRREVMEETAIEVEDIRYFGSQPWPFPHSLMVGFTARWAGGEIRVADDELVDAGWYAADSLPPVPGRISIARRLIDWFSSEFGSTAY